MRWCLQIQSSADPEEVEHVRYRASLGQPVKLGQQPRNTRPRPALAMIRGTEETTNPAHTLPAFHLFSRTRSIACSMVCVERPTHSQTARPSFSDGVLRIALGAPVRESTLPSFLSRPLRWHVCMCVCACVLRCLLTAVRCRTRWVGRGCSRDRWCWAGSKASRKRSGRTRTGRR